MKYAKFFGLLALAAGMASAADWGDVRNDNRGDRMRVDSARVEMQSRDGFRGERLAAGRDQRAVDGQYRNVRHDSRDRDYDRDWR
jgi:hypothetical protein